MRHKGCTKYQINQAAKSTGIRVNHTGPDTFTLKTKGSNPPYKRYSQRINEDPSKTRSVVPGSVCWHGHRDFFRELFKIAPTATIKTALATYEGKEDFEEKFESTKDNTDHSYYEARSTASYSNSCICYLRELAIKQWEDSKSDPMTSDDPYSVNFYLDDAICTFRDQAGLSDGQAESIMIDTLTLLGKPVPAI